MEVASIFLRYGLHAHLDSMLAGIWYMQAKVRM